MAATSFMSSSFLLHRLGGAAVTLLAVVSIASRTHAQTLDPASQNPPPQQSEELDQLRPLNQASSNLSIAAARQLLADADEAIAAQDYPTAVTQLTTARETLNQLSNYYAELSTIFLGISSQINQSHRQRALETAQLRDRASYQLALVYRQQNQLALAAPLFLEVLQSQQITRELGQQSYEQLQELEQTPENPLSIDGGQRFMDEASQAISIQDYATAADRLSEARSNLNRLSNSYSQLANLFLGIEPETSQRYQDLALQAAQLRDQATYQLALVYRAQDRADLAVPPLIEIVQSQQPTRDLGQRAYQQLFELGFVEEPFNQNASAISE